MRKCLFVTHSLKLLFSLLQKLGLPLKQRTNLASLLAAPLILRILTLRLLERPRSEQLMYVEGLEVLKLLAERFKLRLDSFDL